MRRPLPPEQNLLAAQLLFEEARRQLERQEASLGDIRTQAAALLGAAGLVNGLFGVRAASAVRTHSAFVYVALSAFVVMTGLVLAIQRPRRYRFNEDLTPWLLDYGSGQARRPIDYYNHFARAFNTFRGEQATKIDRHYDLFSGACVLLAVQVFSWGLSVVV